MLDDFFYRTALPVTERTASKHRDRIHTLLNGIVILQKLHRTQSTVKYNCMQVYNNPSTLSKIARHYAEKTVGIIYNHGAVRI